MSVPQYNDLTTYTAVCHLETFLIFSPTPSYHLTDTLYLASAYHTRVCYTLYRYTFTFGKTDKQRTAIAQ